MKTMFVKISNIRIYFNESDSIRIEDTNIPHENLRFNTEYKEIFREVELIEFVKVHEELSVKVSDYSPGNTDSFQDQRCKYPFTRIKLDLIDWCQVKSRQSSY